MSALTHAELTGRLAVDEDPQVSRWAVRVAQRVSARQVSLTREYGRLLAPLVDSGLVIATADGFEITLAGQRAVREMLATDAADLEAVAA